MSKQFFSLLFAGLLLICSVQANGPNEGLPGNSVQLVGKTLVVKPGYGWGWNGKGDPVPPNEIEIKLERLVRASEQTKGTFQGGVGKIINTNDTALKNRFIIFSIRQPKPYKLNEKGNFYRFEVVPADPGEKVILPSDDTKAKSTAFAEIYLK